MIEELRGCPFCGGPAKYIDEDSLHVRVQCQYCGTMTKALDKEHVTRMWNQRVQG